MGAQHTFKTMVARLQGRYRVDNIPRAIAWWYNPASTALGTAHYGWHRLVGRTSRVEFVGRDLESISYPVIFAVWHSEIFALFSSVKRIRGLAIINHPLWYMKQTHVLLRWFGVEKIILGSTGHGGREAASELSRLLRNTRYSSFITPDGPSGPSRKIRKGVFHIAHQSGLPIVPITIRADFAMRLPGWDRKVIPLPFGRIRLYVGPDVLVPSSDFVPAQRELERELNHWC